MMPRLRDIASALRLALRSRGGALAAVLAAAAVLVAVAVLPSLGLIDFVLEQPELTARVKLASVLEIAWASRAHFGTAGGILTILLAALFGLNVALLAHFVRCRMRLARREAGASVVGIFAGIIGAGCAACGSVLLVSFLGTAAATAVIGFLPLHGLEFSLVGILALAVSILTLSRRIAAPAACAVPR